MSCPCHLPRPSSIVSAFVLALALAACGAAPPPKPEIEDIGKPSPELLAKLAAVEKAYLTRAPEYERLRDEVRHDPVAAGWLTRSFVYDVFKSREGTPLDDDEILRAAAKIDNPVERRAIEQIVELGADAVPVLVGDLLLHSQAQTREVGIELLDRVGAPALPRLLEVSRSDDPLHRRSAARALTTFTSDAGVVARLCELAHDPEFTVRADAVRSLRAAPPSAAGFVRDVLANDSDPFVRRAAAQALVGHPGRANALALVDYLDRCKADVDARGYEAAQEALQQLAGRRGPRTPGAWRQWAEQQPQ
ncbi:MAG: HEAT repeat domain-containing protein [Planctomycetes bacterium]|nr:HEAT repeat domain-containing protein [Planctomycetota bacterium]